MKKDISFLFKECDFDSELLLKIVPLTSLSVVDSVGSYYLTNVKFNHIKLYGMIENLIGFHFGEEIRKEINKKQSKVIKGKIEKLSKYIPVLDNHLKFDEIFTPNAEYYNDLWTQCMKHTDKRHLGGSREIDSALKAKINAMMVKVSGDADDTNTKEIDAKLNNLVKENLGKLPTYYTRVTNRGYMILDGDYIFKIKTNKELKSEILKNIEENNLCYLGNSESLVHLEIIEN